MTAMRGGGGWWGQPDSWEETPSLSILHLLENHTLDTATAALVWLFVERKASLIVAAPPQGAGKTTMLTALLGLRQPQVELVHTRGVREDFAFLKKTDPAKTYILCNEISPHTPMYLWGDKVVTVFQAMDRGYSLGATMHADSPQEVLDDLRHPDVEVPATLLRHLSLVVNLEARNTRRGVLRRLREVWMQEADLSSDTLSFRAIAQWKPQDDSFALDRSPDVLAAIGKRLAFQGDLQAELERRRLILQGWLDDGVRSYDDVRRKVAEL